MSKNVTVIVEATNQDGTKHSKVTLETNVPDSAGVAAVQDAVNEGLKSLRANVSKTA